MIVCYHKRISCYILSPPLWAPTSSSGLCCERLELLERLCQALPAFRAGPCSSRRAAGRQQWRALSQSRATKRLQGVPRPPGGPLWTALRYTNTRPAPFLLLLKCASPQRTNTILMNSELSFLIRPCIHHQHGVWQAEAEA